MRTANDRRHRRAQGEEPTMTELAILCFLVAAALVMDGLTLNRPRR
jgi:hypothetical protein